MKFKINFFDVTFSFLFLVMTITSMYYFSLTISIEENVANFNVILFAIFLGLVCVTMLLYKQYRIFIKKSSLLFLVFLSYLLLRITLDIGNFTYFKSILVYYTLGVLLTVSLNHILLNSKKYASMKIIYKILLFAISLSFTILISLKLPEILSEMKTDVFLVKDRYFDYQTPGNALVFMFLIYVLIYNYLSILIPKKLSFSYIILFVMVAINLIIGMFISQVLGSNNALVCIAGLFFVTIIFQLYNTEKIKDTIARKSFFINNIFKSKLFFSYLRVIIYSFFIFIFIILMTLYILDIDINKFRIFSFGGGEVASIQSRLELLNNFVVHLDYSPIFGNINVENLTTGTGTYTHSFITSLMTHTGILGFLIFFIWLVVAIKEKIKPKEVIGEKRYIENSLMIYSMTVFIGFFLIASVGVFFIRWIPIWFLFGFVFMPIVLKKKGQTCTQ